MTKKRRTNNGRIIIDWYTDEEGRRRPITAKKGLTKKVLKKIHASRSKIARSLDEKYRAKRVPAKAETWIKNPGRYDLPDVDMGEISRSRKWVPIELQVGRGSTRSGYTSVITFFIWDPEEKQFVSNNESKNIVGEVKWNYISSTKRFGVFKGEVKVGSIIKVYEKPYKRRGDVEYFLVTEKGLKKLSHKVVEETVTVKGVKVKVKKHILPEVKIEETVSAWIPGTNYAVYSKKEISRMVEKYLSMRAKVKNEIERKIIAARKLAKNEWKDLPEKLKKHLTSTDRVRLSKLAENFAELIEKIEKVIRKHNVLVDLVLVPGSRKIMVSGQTYPIKDELKKLGFKWQIGGIWEKKYVPPAELRLASVKVKLINKALKEGGNVKHVIKGMEILENDLKSLGLMNSTKISFGIYEGKLWIAGSPTYELRHKLKALGYTYSRKHGVWMKEFLIKPESMGDENE